MTNNKYFFTSESVSEGHPDKVCDRISDMVVDAYLSKEPYARVACETLATTNKVVLAGEIRGPKINNEDIWHERIKNSFDNFIQFMKLLLKLLLHPTTRTQSRYQK